MAASLLVNCSLTLSDTGVNETSNPGTRTVTPTSSKNSAGVISVPTTSGGVAIPLAGLSVPGYCQVTNLDLTNYIQILTAVSGTAFARLLAGETAVFRFDPALTAPAWIAHTAACNVNLLVVDGS